MSYGKNYLHLALSRISPVLRFAMIQYGQRSPIGSKHFLPMKLYRLILGLVRQEKLLQGLMREIVRMTAQKHPLEVGIPLYPFSHQTLFRKDEPLLEEESTGAPLPTLADNTPSICIL